METAKGHESGKEEHAEEHAGLAPVMESEPVTSVSGALNDSQSFQRRVRIGINASWAINITLFVAKMAVFILSKSLAVLASAIDSLVDLLSQAVLAMAEWQAARYDERYPIGRTRAAELAVLACAGIMFISTVLVIRESVGVIIDGIHGDVHEVEVGPALYAVLGAATVLKLGLFIYCRALRRNPIMLALAEDHANDIMSNVAAIVGAAVAGNVPRLWYVDPGVAIGFSLLIIRNWLKICWEQGQKMIGLGAPAELVAEVNAVAEGHHPKMQLDRVTAYHHGSNVVVEVTVIVPGGMTVDESHDIAVELQHKIEAIDSVERAFVHVDVEHREEDLHKVERNLKQGVRDVMQPLLSLESGNVNAAPSPRPPATLEQPPTDCARDFSHTGSGLGSSKVHPLPVAVRPATPPPVVEGTPALRTSEGGWSKGAGGVEHPPSPAIEKAEDASRWAVSGRPSIS